MRRFLRLLTLWLLALGLPIQGAAAATAMAGHAGAPPMSHTMVMPNGTAMDAAAMPPGVAGCHQHQGVDKAGCGACCGPLLAQQALLTVVPVATCWAQAPRAAARTPAALFLTGGTDRPPRHLLA